MKLYDTAKKCYKDFNPGDTVRIYVCGITPYDSAHLGHIFTFMTYDLLQRRLEDKGHRVQMVRNITDVDEPIYERAREEGISYTELAERETLSFQQTMRDLHFIEPFAEPRASLFIPQMIEAISSLQSSGFAYQLEEDIYFDTAKVVDYGSFSGFSEKLLQGLLRLRGGDPDRAGKRNVCDFLLWKGVTDPTDPAQWASPFGTGRPGWHIECTVMSCTLLGTPFDLHGGGTDLIFPHHEAELAQSFGLGEPHPVKTWMHVSPLLHDGEKMSKSLGNLVFARDLLKTYDFATIRLALMQYHHRIGGEWQDELLADAADLLTSVRASAATASQASAEGLLSSVRAELDDDLNTLEVIDSLHRFVSESEVDGDGSGAALLSQTLRLLGLEA